MRKQRVGSAEARTAAAALERRRVLLGGNGQLDRAVAEGFVRQVHRDGVGVALHERINRDLKT